jgi:transposase
MATIDAVVGKYVALRDELDAARKTYNQFEKEQKGKMERLSMWLKEKSDELGVESFATKHGTAYKTTKDYVRVGDWAEVLDFIKETNNWQMLEKRIGKIATKEIMEESGSIPPGVEYSQDIEFQVRRPTK